MNVPGSRCLSLLAALCASCSVKLLRIGVS